MVRLHTHHGAIAAPSAVREREHMMDMARKTRPWTGSQRLALRAGVVILAALLGAGCRTPAPAPGSGDSAQADLPVARYRALAARGPVYVLDAAASSVRIFVYRGGPMARMGHNHVVAVTDFRGAVYLPDDTAQARFDLVFPLEALAVDRPGDRAAAAGAFDSAPDAEAVAGTRANMLGPEVLAAHRHPRIGLRSTAVDGDLPVIELTLEVTLHGQRRQLTLPVWIERADERLVAEGHFRLRPSRFGIEPFSVAGGALQVQDALGIRFRLVGERQPEPFRRPQGREQGD